MSNGNNDCQVLSSKSRTDSTIQNGSNIQQSLADYTELSDNMNQLITFSHFQPAALSTHIGCQCSQYIFIWL